MDATPAYLYERPRDAFLAGMRVITPMLFGAVPFGLVVGVLSAENQLSVLQMLIFSGFIFAGVSQLVAFQLYAQDAAVWVIVLSAAVVNLRHVIYSASIAPYFKPYAARWKLLIASLLVDQTYAFSIAHFDKYPAEPHKQWYYLGTGALIWTMWMVAVVVGYFVGAVIPASLSLSFVVPVIFLGLLVPAIKGYPYLAAAVVAATVAIVAADAPHNLGLVIAILAGLVTGTLLDKDA